MSGLPLSGRLQEWRGKFEVQQTNQAAGEIVGNENSKLKIHECPTAGQKEKKKSLLTFASTGRLSFTTG